MAEFTNASRSRSRIYCSGTQPGSDRSPPHQDVRDLVGDQRVVLGGEPAFAEACRPPSAARPAHPAPPPRFFAAAAAYSRSSIMCRASRLASASRCALFSTIRSAGQQEAHVARLFGALGDFRQRDVLKHFLQMRQHIGVRSLHHRVDHAAQHFLAARSRREQAHADLRPARYTVRHGRRCAPRPS